jgi:hypothetical protein
MMSGLSRHTWVKSCRLTIIKHSCFFKSFFPREPTDVLTFQPHLKKVFYAVTVISDAKHMIFGFFG